MGSLKMNTWTGIWQTEKYRKLLRAFSQPLAAEAQSRCLPFLFFISVSLNQNLSCLRFVPWRNGSRLHCWEGYVPFCPRLSICLTSFSITLYLYIPNEYNIYVFIILHLYTNRVVYFYTTRHGCMRYTLPIPCVPPRETALQTPCLAANPVPLW